MTNGAIAAGGLKMQGQTARISGLNGILNAQTSVYGAQSKQDDGFGSMLSGLGGLGQGIGAMKTAFFPPAAGVVL